VKTCKIAIKTNDHPRGTLAQAEPRGPGYAHDLMLELHGTQPRFECQDCTEHHGKRCSRCTVAGDHLDTDTACGLLRFPGESKRQSDYQRSDMRPEDLQRAANGAEARRKQFAELHS
jgi:hypothetical protein